ncbi:MAG: DUF3426 domain-containing protein [Hydrogenophilus sp.]|nr:DUF3426 domain-containing protein [Hydrogenophilus sp.]
MTALTVCCPHCRAAFATSLQALEPSGGWALCGECLLPFDAIAHALSPAGVSLSPLQRSKAPPPRDRLPTLVRPLPPSSSSVSSPSSSDSPSAASSSGGGQAAAFPPPPLRFTTPSSPSVSPSRPSSPSASPSRPSSSPSLPRSSAWAQSTRRLVSILLILLLSLTAVWQTLLVAHQPLIRQYPSLYPWWDRACKRLGCTVSPPADREKLLIDDARLIKEPQPNRYTLEFALTNTAPYPMPWPHLAVTLTDGLGRAIIRKLLPPDQWRAPLEHPFQPRQRVVLLLTWEMHESGVVGFEVSPYYP